MAKSRTPELAATREPEKSLGSLVNDLARQFKITFDRQAVGLGLTRPQWQLLLHLHRRDGMTQTQLAAVLELSVPTVGNLVHRLVAHGWIEIRIDPTHRLNKYLHLRPNARPALREVHKLARKVDAQATGGMSAAEIAQLVALLSRMKRNLDAIRRSGTQAAKPATTRHSHTTLETRPQPPAITTPLGNGRSAKRSGAPR